MRAKELFGEQGPLKHKLRSQNDLAEHIRTSVDGSPNYAVFLGAGCSVTSGIDSGIALINKWMRELYPEKDNNLNEKELYEYFCKKETSWFNSSNPYSSLFEKKYDLPTQRRRFVELQVDNKLPSIGYAYLIDLVNKGQFSTIFTTNFDDLIQEAFYQFSDKRPIMCAHDSSVHSISVTSSRPKIIKLHGDYLFDDIKSTLRETESLEQNIKDKLIEFCKEFGLIILGYSGNDRSIIDVLEFLTKQDYYLNNGLYWCFREDDDVNTTLQNLLWRDRVYPVLIDGFDEFFAEIHKHNIDDGLDIESNFSQSKLNKAIKLMIDDDFSLAKNHLILDEINRLKNMDQKTKISNFITKISKEDDPSISLTMSDYRNLLEMESLVVKGDIKKAIELAESKFYESHIDRVKPQYLDKLIKLSLKLGEKGAALKWTEKLIELDPNNIYYLLRKSKLLVVGEKARYLKKLHEKYPKKHIISNEYVRELLKELKHDPTKKQETEGIIFNILDQSLLLEPSLNNDAWELKYNALDSMFFNSEEYTKESFEKVISKANEINPCHIRTLTIKAKYAGKRKDGNELKKIIDQLYDEFNISSLERQMQINELMSDVHFELIDALDKDEYTPILRKFFESHLADKKIEKNPELLLAKVKYQIGQAKNKDKAEGYFNSLLEISDCLDVLPELINVLDCFEQNFVQKVKAIVEQNKFKIGDKLYYYYISEIHVIIQEYDKALKFIERAFDEGLSLESYLVRYSYICLLMKKYEPVIELSEKYKKYQEERGFEAWKINYNYALKKKNITFNKVSIRNLSAQSSCEDIRIAAFSLLNNTKDAKREISKEIDKDYMNYYRFNKWPILEDILEKIEEEVSA